METTESILAEGCAIPKWKGDGHCDDGNNNPSCDYDGGDCCTDERLVHCRICECKDPKFSTSTTFMSSTPSTEDCRYPFWKNDGECDDGNNTEDCDFDGGDCCTDTEQEHCTFCECKDPGHENYVKNQTMLDCEKPNRVGDGHCDDGNNYSECDFDGGDCCIDTTHAYCDDCLCKEPGKSKPRKCPRPQWIGDGTCDDSNNVEECDYDGGDCCSDLEKKYCKVCECKYQI